MRNWIKKIWTKPLCKEDEELHEVPVYDNDRNVIDKTMQSLHVECLTRWEHTFDTYTTYSWNTHHIDGLICYGLIPYPTIHYPITQNNDEN